MAKEKLGGLFIEVEIDNSQVSKTLKEVKSDINSSVKTFQNYDTALKNSEKTLEDFDKALSSNNKAMNVLESSIKGIKDKMSDLEKETNGLNDATKEQRDQYKSLNVLLSQSEANYNKLQRSSEQLKRQMAYEKNGVNDAEKAYKDLKEQQSETFDNAEKGLDKNKAKLSDYKREQQELRNVIRTLKSTINDLSNEFGENSEEVKQAKSKLNDYRKVLQDTNKEIDNVGANSMDSKLSKVNELGKAVASVAGGMKEVAGIAVGAGLAAAVSTAKDYKESIMAIKTQTTLTADETQRLADVAKEVYIDGFGDSMKDVAQVVTTITKNMGNLNKADLSTVTKAVMTMDAAGSDMDENIRGMAQLMKTFGLTATQASDLVSSGFKQNLDYSHELGDNLAEYAPLWKQYGFNANEMFNLLKAGTNGTSYNLDKVNDLIKEMGISLKDGRMDKNMNKFSKSTQKAFLAYKNGSGTAKPVIQGMIKDISSMKNEQEAASLASTMWGSLGEDNALKVMNSMNQAKKSFSGVSGESKKMSKESKNEFTELDSATRELMSTLAPIGTKVAKTATGFVNGCSDIWGAAKEIPGQFKESFGEAWGTFKSDMGKIGEKAGETWGDIKSNCSKALNTVKDKVSKWPIVKGFSEKFDSTMKETGSFSESLKAGIRGGIDDVKERVQNWSIVKKFTEKWDSIKEKSSEFVEGLKKKISDMIGNIVDSIKNSTIAKVFTEVFDKAWGGIAKVLQAICNGAAWVLEKLGADDAAKTIKNWGENLNPKKYARGTDSGGHPGGLMMVNDAPGINYREMVIRPNGEAFIPEGRDVVMYGEPGTQVVRAENTSAIMQSMMMPKYADGVGWFDKAINFGRRTIGKIKDVVSDVWEYATHPGKLVDKVYDSFVGKFEGFGYAIDVSKAAVKKTKDALLSRVKALFAEAEESGGGYIEGSWGDLGSNNWMRIGSAWVREWQYRLLEPIIKKYGFMVTDGGRRTWDNFDHSKNKAMDIALPGNPQGIYWKVAHIIDKMPLVSYVNSNLMSTYGHKGKFTPSTFEPLANHIHVSFVKEFLTEAELRGNKGRRAGGSVGNPGGSGVARWRPYVIRALRANGLPTTPAYVNAWMRQIATESMGNPRAIGGDDGLNEGNAMGLLQVKPGTFAANKHAGHNNILNGYDNMLAAMRYALKRYGYSGMLSAIGQGRGYENGGLITQHQIAELGEGNKPEMVIPLTDTSRSVQLIKQAQRFVGEEHFKKEEEYKKENNQLMEVIKVLNEQTQLLKALIMKDTDVYLDGNKVSSAMESRAKQMQLKRNIANGTI